MAPGEDRIAAIPDHGGSLERARRLFPGAPEPFIDLSTGINPHAYPFSPPAATSWTRLPEPGGLAGLAQAAARAYGAPGGWNVVAAAGTQLLLPLVMGLAAPGRAKILGPTYAEHARCAGLAGHEVEEVAGFEALFGAELAVAVNPNNPDGRVLERARLLALAEDMRARGGLLVVDEAFLDVGPDGTSLCGDVEGGGIVVLRSFGKFFGLAGLRLGFAVASREIAARLEALLGPWAVSGPAIEIGLEALGDREWREEMRERLSREAAGLDALLAGAELTVSGGASLYRYLEMSDAAELYGHLGRRGILVRAFDALPLALRIGLPAGEAEWQRLAAALGEWRRKAA